VRSPIFDQANREKQSTTRWTMQSDKMLRVGFGPEALAAKGAMVAYQVSSTSPTRVPAARRIF
jgi:hypothetical protein